VKHLESLTYFFKYEQDADILFRADNESGTVIRHQFSYFCRLEEYLFFLEIYYEI